MEHARPHKICSLVVGLNVAEHCAQTFSSSLVALALCEQAFEQNLAFEPVNAGLNGFAHERQVRCASAPRTKVE